MQSLTPAMRVKLAELFRTQVEECVLGLSEAILRGDADERRRAAHLLKGSSAAIGASRLRSLCERIEQSSRAGDPQFGEDQLEQLRHIATEAVEAVGGALT